MSPTRQLQRRVGCRSLPNPPSHVGGVSRCISAACHLSTPTRCPATGPSLALGLGHRAPVGWGPQVCATLVRRTPPPPHNAVGFSGAMRHGCWGSHLSLPLVCFHVTGMATSPKAHKHSDGSTLLTPPRPRQFAAKEAFQMAVFWGILCGIVTRSRNCPRNKRV